MKILLDEMQLFRSIIELSRSNKESVRKSELLRSKWKKKRAVANTTKLTSWAPGWLKLNENKFEIIPDRVKIVKSIFKDCASGIGIYKITRRLNEAGIECFGSARGPQTSWYNSYVARILNSRAVLGEFQPHKRDKNGKSVPDGPVIADYFPAIIDKDLFYQAKNARTQRDLRGGAGKGRKGELFSNLFAGVARCVYCGGSVLFENKGMLPKGGKYLVCDSSRRGLGCPGSRWRYDDFEASFLSFVHELELGHILKFGQSSLEALDNELASLDGQIQTLQQRQDAILQTIELMENKTSIAKQLDALAAQIENLQAQRTKKSAARNISFAEAAQFDESTGAIKELLDAFKAGTAEDIFRLRAQIASRIRSLVETIMIASVGSAPMVDELIELERSKHKLNKAKLRTLEDALEKPDTNRRYISVRFKDGSVRIIVPSKDDPLLLEVHAFGKDQNTIVEIDAKGRRRELGPARELSMLDFAKLA